MNYRLLNTNLAKPLLNFDLNEEFFSYVSNDNSDIITVSKPSLPPVEEFIPLIQQIWRSGQITNNGEFHKKFENVLGEYLDNKNVSLVANGTLALLLALKALDVKGEVITTPYSFVATSHVLNWNGLTPIFCDINPKTLNICSKKIEPLITENTTAILATHVYGRPCDLEKIDLIAKKYNLKVIYDAAHAFGVKVNNKSLLNFGDVSAVSFHGTKVFTTFEGGAVVAKNNDIKLKIDMYKNFAFKNENTVVDVGINAKMNEFQAALGLLQFKYFDKYINCRKRLYNYYLSKLKHISGIDLNFIPKNLIYNYSYLPIFINKKKFGKSRDELYDHLKHNNILARKYFYPLITDYPSYKNSKNSSHKDIPNAFKISRSVLCLPLHTSLDTKIINKIIYLIKNI